MNGAAALGGYLLFPAPAETVGAALVLLGTALLAAGGSALNQAAEVDLDAAMERTRNRPVPAGRISPRAARLLGAAAAAAGGALLLAAGGWLPPLLGAAALALYLLAYTPLKRRTSLALAVGAVAGAVPPLVGWAAAGGDPADHRAVLLAGILYLWQVPHFWLLQRRCAGEYLRAGIPVAPGASPAGGAPPLLPLWLAALAAASALLPALGVVAGGRALVVVLLPLMPLAASLFRAERLLPPLLHLFPLLLTLALSPGS
jgi:protoheme IX farnesyltransferase